MSCRRVRSRLRLSPMLQAVLDRSDLACPAGTSYVGESVPDACAVADANARAPNTKDPLVMI
jgi:hypothetical protein